MTRRRAARLLLGLCLLATPLATRAELAPGPAARADVGDALVFGVFPYLTARKIIETYQPLAASLEKQLKRRVLLYTASDFKTFAERTRRGEYDLLLTAPHLAWLAIDETKYVPLLAYAHPVRGLIVAREDAPFGSLTDLRGRVIATAAPSALVVLAARADLAGHGLEREGDYVAINAISHVNAAMLVVRARADAAILAEQPFSTMRPELRAQLRVLHRTRPLPGLVYLTHPRLDARASRTVRDALQQFGRSAEGRALLARGNHGSLVPASADGLAAMRSFAQQAALELGQTR